MTNILVNDFVLVMMVFMRVFAAFVTAPIFGHQSIPGVARMFLAMTISYIIALSIYNVEFNFSLDLWSIVLTALKELLTGAIIGFSINFVFYAISFAGTIIGFEMGLQISEMFNPIDESSSNVIGELLYFAAFLVFFLINGHHYIIQALSYSFKIIPIGTYSLTTAVYHNLIELSGMVFVLAVKISSPIIVSFFLVHIAEGVIARAIPQMQVFFVTQPLKLGLGFVLLSMIVPVYIYVIKNLLKNYEDTLLTIIKGMAT